MKSEDILLGLLIFVILYHFLTNFRCGNNVEGYVEPSGKWDDYDYGDDIDLDDSTDWLAQPKKLEDKLVRYILTAGARRQDLPCTGWSKLKDGKKKCLNCIGNKLNELGENRPEWPELFDQPGGPQIEQDMMNNIKKRVCRYSA